MAFWSRNNSVPRKTHRQQIEEYDLTDRPFSKGLLLCAVAEIETTHFEEGCQWKDLDDAILNSAITVAFHIVFEAMKANGHMLLLAPGVVVQQPAVRAVIGFSNYVLMTLHNRVTNEGITIDLIRLLGLFTRTLFLTIREEEWNRISADVTKVVMMTAKELAQEGSSSLDKWKGGMNTFVPAYVLSFSSKDPAFRVLNYPGLFEVHLATLLKAAN
ncbi:MAG: hypothetical protein JSR31_04625 [Nitrospira sp.]|nr:hypothetical protein [Nitrospira sp.]